MPLPHTVRLSFALSVTCNPRPSKFDTNESREMNLFMIVQWIASDEFDYLPYITWWHSSALRYLDSMA